MDALCEPVACAACSSDPHQVHAGLPAGLVLGHEAAARILEVGSEVKLFKPGDIVAVGAVTPDYFTTEIQDSIPQHSGGLFGGMNWCTVENGTFAQYFRIRQVDMNACPIPEGLTYEHAVMAADMCTTGFHGAELADIQFGDTVVVCSGGPAGMEAARVAAIKGHKVTLFEKSNRLGGVMGDICTASFKQNIRKLTTWYTVQLEKLNVDIHLNTEICGDEKILASCDRIIIGCGAVPLNPAISGLDGSNVVNILDAHRNPSLLKGKHIVVCGGGASGLDGALEMASEMGKDVTIVEMLPQCGKDVFFINQITLFRKLAEANVSLMTNTKVLSIDFDGLTVQCDDGHQKHLDADTVVTAFGMRPDLSIVEKIKEKYYIKTRVVGDSNRLGKIGEAVRDGFYTATSI